MANQNGYSFATWTSFIEESQIRTLLKYKVPYYFAGGKPGIIPTEIFANIMADLSERYKEDPKLALEDFNYGPTAGQPWFLKTLAKRLCETRDIPIDCEIADLLFNERTGNHGKILKLNMNLCSAGDTLACVLGATTARNLHLEAEKRGEQGGRIQSPGETRHCKAGSRQLAAGRKKLGTKH